MIQFFALAVAAFGGGFALKKFFETKHAEPGGASSSTSPSSISVHPIDEFLEERTDGLLQLNRSTAVSILGWLGSVSLATPPQRGANGVIVSNTSDLLVPNDGSPPAAGTVASKLLVQAAKDGMVVLVSRDLTIVGRPERKAAWLDPADKAALKELAGVGWPSGAGNQGGYAILIVPSNEKVDPSLPPLPGYENSPPKDVPGTKPLPSEDSTPSDSLPADLRRQIDDLLKKHDGDPEMLLKVSRQLRAGGYAQEAALIEARAADMRALNIVTDVKVKGRTFVIPDGHPGAIALCKKLTGDGKRFGDLLATNPALTADSNGVVSPWTPGQVVRLPPSWSA